MKVDRKRKKAFAFFYDEISLLSLFSLFLRTTMAEHPMLIFIIGIAAGQPWWFCIVKAVDRGLLA